MRTVLQCNDCGHKFEDRVMFGRTQTHDGNWLKWTAEEKAPRGHRCPRPQCRSERIIVEDVKLVLDQ